MAGSLHVDAQVDGIVWCRRHPGVALRPRTTATTMYPVFATAAVATSPAPTAAARAASAALRRKPAMPLLSTKAEHLKKQCPVLLKGIGIRQEHGLRSDDLRVDDL